MDASTSLFGPLRGWIRNTKSSLQSVPSAMATVQTALQQRQAAMDRMAADPPDLRDENDAVVESQALIAGLSGAFAEPATQSLHPQCAREAAGTSHEQSHATSEPVTANHAPSGLHEHATIPAIVQYSSPDYDATNDSNTTFQSTAPEGLVATAGATMTTSTDMQTPIQHISEDLAPEPDMAAPVTTPAEQDTALQTAPTTTATEDIPQQDDHGVLPVAMPLPSDKTEIPDATSSTNEPAPDPVATSPVISKAGEETKLAPVAPTDIQVDSLPTDAIVAPHTATLTTDSFPAADATAGAAAEEHESARDDTHAHIDQTAPADDSDAVRVALSQSSEHPGKTTALSPEEGNTLPTPPQEEEAAEIVVKARSPRQTSKVHEHATPVEEVAGPAHEQDAEKALPMPRPSHSDPVALPKGRKPAVAAQYKRSPNALRLAATNQPRTPKKKSEETGKRYQTRGNQFSPKPRGQNPTDQDRNSLLVTLKISSSPNSQTPATGAKRKQPADEPLTPTQNSNKKPRRLANGRFTSAPKSSSQQPRRISKETSLSTEGDESDEIEVHRARPRAKTVQQSTLDRRIKPQRDVEGDEKFVEDVKAVLEVQGKRKTHNMGRRQANRILALLKLARYPAEDEAKFLSTEEATAAVAPNQFWTSIIVTEGQQVLPLQTVDDFLDEYYDDDTEVWIQDPAIKPGKLQPVTRKVKMSKVKDRLAGKSNGQPWNLLELATHCDDGLRPLFLNTEDCRLLSKLKIPDSADEARRKTYEAGYKEVEKWALTAQAGALTEPHQDSHGYSTYITVNQGLIGFGWLLNPTPEERAAWKKSPMTFTGGNWRYIVLKPGQTVYFPAGTVHFVFRLPSAGHTLAFGGHILRCSNLVHWVKTLIEERDEKNITNEDLTDSSSGYLHRTERFVRKALTNGTAQKWGGEQAIDEFLRLKKKFEQKKQK